MGPYTKTQTASAIYDGWEIRDGDDAVIAILDTETLADAVLASLGEPATPPDAVAPEGDFEKRFPATAALAGAWSLPFAEDVARLALRDLMLDEVRGSEVGETVGHFCYARSLGDLLTRLITQRDAIVSDYEDRDGLLLAALRLCICYVARLVSEHGPEAPIDVVIGGSIQKRVFSDVVNAPEGFVAVPREERDRLQAAGL